MGALVKLMNTKKLMTSRLEALFSPERLRQNWETKDQSIIECIAMTENMDIHLKFNELKKLIGEKFKESHRLSGNFDDLTKIIHQTYLLDEVCEPVDIKNKLIIVHLLEQLEELIWAMHLSVKS